MTISLRDARDSRRARLWIQSVYRDYLDDLAPDADVFPTLPEIGHREPDQVAYWFGDPRVHPLIILKDADPVGFAMVARGAGKPVQPPVDYRMAEFFVARTCRRLGIGQSAVQLILSRFAGRWEISCLNNAAAVSFWRRVVTRYTCGNYQERIDNDQVRQVFDSARKPRLS